MAGEGGGGRAGVERQRPQAGAERHACHEPGDQGAKGRQGEEGVGEVPRVLHRDVYAGRVQRGRGQGDRGPGTQGPGKGGKGGRGRTNTRGAGLGQGTGVEGGSKEGGLPRELLRTVLARAERGSDEGDRGMLSARRAQRAREGAEGAG